MKDRTRHTRTSPLTREPSNRRTRRKESRNLTREYRSHRKACSQCRESVTMPDKVLTPDQIQARRCLEGQEIYSRVFPPFWS